MTVAVVLVSAGKGTRLGASVPKAAVTIAGKSLLELSLERIAEFSPDQLIVVAPADLVIEFEALTEKYFDEFTVVVGGETRQQSVESGLSAVETELVLVHDAARAFTPREVFDRVHSALASSVSVVPAIAVTDTIKVVQDDHVEKTLDRGSLRAIQTPQGFKVETLRKALGEADGDFTDEAGLLESLGHKTFVVEGHQDAFKITTASDLEMARNMFSQPRSGIGVDAHQFDTSGELVLGCLVWPEHPKLVGHSDGDAIAHAIVDALLSAAGLGDIGSNFGTDRPEYSGASGEVFLTKTVELISGAGYEPINVSVQVVGDKPKISPRRQELEQRLSGLVGAPVSVLATTTDGLGFLADAKGVAAVATSLIQKRG